MRKKQAPCFQRMLSPHLLYQLALTVIPGIGPVQARILLQHCDADEIFYAKKSFLEKIEGIGPSRAAAITAFRDFTMLENEIRFIERQQIQPLFITDADYPKRLLNCYDSPVLLFYKGRANLNAQKIVAIVGTRKNTDYGKQVTETIVHELASQNVLVISGLAFGIDAIAHRAALENKLSTIGVLAHGLDQLYPGEHAHLARDMTKTDGGLLTEFRSNTKPDRHNFPGRNRIVAGMSDAILVIETAIKGGSMITAELANGYNKDVFAVPGRLTDRKSAGANWLIKNNKAMIFTSVNELVQAMGWDMTASSTRKILQRKMFIELSSDEQRVIQVLQEKDKTAIDELNQKSGLSTSAVAASILNLELQGLILSLPGKIYRLA